MSRTPKKVLSLLLVLALMFQMVPMPAFADDTITEGSAPTLANRPDVKDSVYYQGVSDEYTADDVLWEIEAKRSGTEKHFRLANGSDIAVSYAFPVHYEDSNGQFQEIDNSLNLYNADGTVSDAPVVSGLLEDAVLDANIQAILREEPEETLPPIETPEVSEVPVEVVVPTETPMEQPEPEISDEIIPEETVEPSPEIEITIPEEEEIIETPEASEPAEEIEAVGEAEIIDEPQAEILEPSDAIADTPEAIEEPLAEEPVSEIVEETPIEEPVAEIPDAGEETEEPVTETPAPEIEEPVIETPAPELEEPVVETPEPVIEEIEAELEIEEEEVLADAKAILEKLPIDTRVYKNTAGLADVELAVSGGAGQLASISYGGYTVSLTPQIDTDTASMKEIATKALSRAGVAAEVRDIAPLAEAGSFESVIMPENLSSAVIYDGLLDGADLEYILGETSLKENIIVNEAAESYSYDFLLETGGLVPAVKENGSIELSDASGNTVFVIPAGYMYDDDGVGSTAVIYALQTIEDGKYILTVCADAAWMNAEDRAFPVTIDPPVYLQGFYGIETGTIYSYDPDAYAGQSATEFIGYFGAYDGYCRTLVRVNNLPTLPDNSYVVYGGLYLYGLTYSHVGMSSMRVQAKALSYNYPIGEYWCLSHSWNNTYDPEPEVIDYADITSTRQVYSWDITREAVKWYNDPDCNYGISLQAALEGSMSYNSCANAGIASSNTSNNAARPYFIVEYRNAVGLENYYSYQSHSIDRAGTGYIGDYSGQLTLVKNDVSSASTINPVSINHVYNSAYSAGEYYTVIDGAANTYKSFEVGRGWMLDCMQIIVPSSNGYLMYVDGDGTVHYFYPSGSVYKDEDGLGLSITKSGSNYTLTDKKDNIAYFTNGMLSYTQDANGNRITYVREDDVPVRVTRQNNGGSAETIATFTYNGLAQLYKITDSAGNTTTFSYTNGLLTTVTHADGTTVSYTYDSNGKMSSATDNESGYSMNYQYDANTGKVNLFYEEAGYETGASVAADGSFSGIQTYRYSGPDGTLDNGDDIINHSILDYFGRTISSYSTNADGSKVFGANFTQYYTNTGTNSSNNRALMSTVTGTQAVNLLGYPSIEGTSNMALTPWTSSGGGTASITFAAPRTGTRSMRIVRGTGHADSYLSQTVSGLDPNLWYVASAYVNTGSVTDLSGEVTMTISGAGSYEGNYVNWSTEGVNDGWERVYVAGQPNSNGQLTLSVKISGLVGTVYVDDLQLEESLFGDRGTPGSASLLTNGSMSSDSTWGDYSNGGMTYDTDETFGDVMRINGHAFDSVDVYQDVVLYQPGTQTYMLSGWAKASAVPLRSDNTRSFSLWVELYYNDENAATEYHNIECNTDTEEWQFVSLPIVPKNPDLQVNSARVYISFYGNPNTAYFADLALTREDAQTYKYNADGELVSVTSTDNEPQSYSYSGADLMSQVTQGNGTIEYNYDSNHNVTSATNDGLTMSIGYDGKGNTTGTTLTGEGTNAVITSSAGYDTAGNLLTSQTDARGKTVTYSYDNAMSKQTGQPTSVTDAKGVTTDTFYNTANGRVTSVGTGYSPYILYNYTGGRLSSMSRTAYVPTQDSEVTQTYSMSYDGFGNMTSINVGNRNLAYYAYGYNNGPLQQLYYATGQAVLYEYDELERVSDVYYNSDVYNPAVSYSYSSNGALSRVDDHAANREYVYNYDALGRLTSMTERSGENAVQVYAANYDSANRITESVYAVSANWDGSFEDAYGYGYTYDSTDGSLSSMYLPDESTYTYTYDDLKRLSNRVLEVDGETFISRNYGYLPGTGTNGTTMMVGSMSNSNGTGGIISQHTYTYDDVGNITAIGGSNPATYTYDSLGQMLTETIDGITTTYTYDEAGNILTVDDGYMEHTYTYGDADWKDLLTAYDGYSISYDAIGNPLSWYDGTSFTWELGRRLMSATNPYTGLSNSYTYNADGLRLTKTVGTVEHKYVWQGSKLISEYYGGKELHFFYDESGAPFAFAYKSSATAAPVFYYYVTNLQGDVIKILNASGSTVATYSYDAWGKILDSSGSMADINPIRYRGYYYDTDTQLYYLQSRYYDPQIARFINGDGLITQGVQGANMFAYCGNSPVNGVDPHGDAWYHWVIGAAVVVGMAVVTVATCGGSLALAASSIGLVGSGVAAATTATTVAAAAFIGTSLAYGATAITAAMESETIEDFNSEGDWGTVATTLTGGVFGSLAGYSMSSSQLAKEPQNTVKHVTGISSPKKNVVPSGTYTQLDNKGSIYSYTQFDSSGRQTMRIDFQGKPHAGVLPHIHLYTYPAKGGRVEYTFDLNWKLID